MNKPMLGFMYPLIKAAADHMRAYDVQMYTCSYKSRWEINEDTGKPAITSLKRFSFETPLYWKLLIVSILIF